jgi:hypothetical protein
MQYEVYCFTNTKSVALKKGLLSKDWYFYEFLQSLRNKQRINFNYHK